MKIVVLGDVRGRWCELALQGSSTDGSYLSGADVILHVGNMGLIPDADGAAASGRMKHVRHFAPTVVDGEAPAPLAAMGSLDSLGASPCPVYALPSGTDDPGVANRLRAMRNASSPAGELGGLPSNVHIVDHLTPHYIATPEGEPELLVFGLPGAFSVHKLFHHGTAPGTLPGAAVEGIPDNAMDALPLSGDPLDTWPTILHVGALLDTMLTLCANDPSRYNRAIKIFMSTTPPFREPLLHHLAIVLRADYTLSGGLFFKNPASFPNLALHPSLESFKSGFAAQKARLDGILAKVEPRYTQMLQEAGGKYQGLYDLAKEMWGWVPSANGTSGPIGLAGAPAAPAAPATPATPAAAGTGAHTQNTPNTVASSQLSALTRPELAAVARNVNDLYYVAFHNTWHLNVTDPQHGHVTLLLENSQLGISTSSAGFDFSHRK